MRSIVISTMLLLICTEGSGQCLYPPHGTLLFAYVCNDGILLAADSRESWDKGLIDSSNNHSFYAHRDSVRKIFPFGRFQIMFTGVSAYKKELIENLIVSYNNKFKTDSTIKTTFEKYKRFVEKKLKISDSTFNQATYIIAGYEGLTPTIMNTDSLNFVISHSTTLRVFSDTTAQEYFALVLPRNCINQIPMVNRMFLEVSKQTIAVGGPTHVIKINQDNSVTTLNTFSFCRPYPNYVAFCKAIVKDEINIVYHFKWSREAVLNQATWVIKCPKCL